MEQKKSKTKQKGITLIALVVTIVVLLILAGVSISLVLGNNGLISKAKDARNAYEQGVVNDETGMNNLYDEIESILGENPGGTGGGSGSGGLSPEDSTATTTPYLPTGFSKLAGTSLSTGLVIQDGRGNQYVWVEVPKTADVYPTAGTTLDLDTLTGTDLETAYSNIEADLHTYTSVYRNNTSYTDTYYEDTNNASNWFTETTYNEAKKNMLKSVYQNGGFYVGRYETGIEASYRPAAGDTTQTPTETPVIKANAYPYNYVTRTQAQTLANNMPSGDKTSSLMFGVQWDLVLKYLETKNAATQSELKTDSKTIGNYNNNLWNITNTVARYSTNNGASWTLCPYEKTATASVLLTTGADASFGKMNIYDIAGNVYEWTLEYTSSTDYPCAGRGGDYSTNGSYVPASTRGSSGSTTVSINRTGFRVSLY